MPVWLLYLFFLLFVLVVLVLDLGVFHRHPAEPGVREALGWTAVWVSLAILFLPVLYLIYQHHWFGAGLEQDAVMGHRLSALDACKVFIAGYLAEEALSLDNVFIIAVALAFFAVPMRYQHRVLFWGILGAVVLRGIMIGIGAALVSTFSWMNYIFGLVLIYTAFRMFASEGEPRDLEQNWGVRLTRRLFPVTAEMHGERFFVREAGRLMVTPLLLVLVVVDFLDVVFAVDSIPAIFSITSDPFLVFTSNIFAILGLRSLYFALAALIKVFRYLKYSLVMLLAFLGIKMLAADVYAIPLGVSLAVILALLGAGVVASVVVKAPEQNSTD